MVFNPEDPVEDIVANQMNDVIRANNFFLVTALNFGHDFTGTGNGWHNSGSAQCYSGDTAPTKKEDNSTPLNPTDYNEKIWFDETTSPAVAKVYTAASTWTPLAQLIGMLDEDDLSSNSSVLPASQQSIKSYVDTEQALNIKIDGSVPFTGEQSMGSNKITNVTNPDDPQDVATKDYVDSQENSAHKTGTYIGDGTSSQGITGLGFQPDYVMVIPQSSQDTHVKTDAMGATASQNITAAGALNNDAIISLDSDGFTVGDGTGDGSNDNMNKSAENYYWIAAKNS